jgi:ribosomal protein L37AE/L43A
MPVFIAGRGHSGRYGMSQTTQAERLIELNKQDAEGELICPFCGDDDYDRIGLKAHLQRGFCDAYENTERI